MSKFWNFLFFQLGWFTCVLGAANKQVLWAVLGTLAYIAFHIWRLDEPKESFRLLVRVLIYGILTGSAILHLGYLDFQDSWPSSDLSPVWMRTLWLLVATTINSSLSWLRGRPILDAIAGPLSYGGGYSDGCWRLGFRGVKRLAFSSSESFGLWLSPSFSTGIAPLWSKA